MNILQRILYAAFYNQIDSAQFSLGRSHRSAAFQDARLDVTKSHRTVLQAKSRDWELSSALYQCLATTHGQYTVGTGIQLPAASSDPEWNKAADEEWETAKPILNLESRLGFDSDQGIAARRDFIEGEVFFLLTSEGPYARYQMIESHRCKTPPALESEEGKTVIDGVRIDPSTNRPLGYYFLTGDKFAFQDATNVIHMYDPDRAQQYRGIPRCTASLNVLHDLQDLRALTMKAAKDAEDLSTIYKTANGELPQSLRSMALKFASTSQANGTPASAQPSILDRKREYYSSARGGSNIVLAQGDDVIQHIPARPGEETRNYWRLLAEDVCADAKIPLSMVYPDSMQGTVFRGSLDSFAAHCRGVTSVYALHFTRIRNYVIQRNSSFNPKLAKLPKDWRKVSPGTVRAPNVDIGRNSNAVISELKSGLRTFSGIAAELGKDGRQLLREKAQEIAFIKELAAEYKITAREVSDAIEEQLAPAIISTATEQADPIAQAKIEMDAYGVGVRAGAITPNKSDEDFFRQKMSLPTTPAEAWQDESTRRPITITPAPGSEPAAIAPQTGAPAEETQQ